MPYDQQRHHRSSIRLAGYDYRTNSMYFVTICTHERALFFAEDRVKQAAEHCWREIPEHFPAVELDEWVVMPNHLHGLLLLSGVGAEGEQGVQLNAPTGVTFPQVLPKRNTLGVIIRTYKAAVTTACRQAGLLGFGWQRAYYDRIVRDEQGLANIRQYIANNPYRWEMDEHHPGRHHSPP